MRAKAYLNDDGSFGVFCPCCEASYASFRNDGEQTCRYCGNHFDFRKPVNWKVWTYAAALFAKLLSGLLYFW